MRLDLRRKYCTYQIDKVRGNFWDTPDSIKVSTHALDTVFEPYENS